MATLPAKVFINNMTAISYGNQIFLLSPVSRTKTIKVQVTAENLIEALSYRNPDTEVAFQYDDKLNLVVGLCAQAITKLHTQHLKTKWHQRQLELRQLEQIEASGSLTLIEC